MKKKSSSSFLFSLFSFLFIFLASCSYKEAVNFWDGSSSRTTLYALSKNAKEGILPLNKEGKLEYNLSEYAHNNDEYSLELSYFWRNEAEAIGQAVLNLGTHSWELPKDLSFLGNSVQLPAISANGDSFLVQYVIPLASGIPEQLTLFWIPYATASKDTSLIIKSIRLVPRWYGVSLGQNGDSIRLSPFVYTADNVLVIDPPLSLGPQGDLEIQVSNPGRIIAQGNESSNGFFRIETDARETFLVPHAFLSPESYPLRITAADITKAELKESSFTNNQPDSGVYMASLTANTVLEPIPADPGLILDWPRQNWRKPNYELFRWDSFPSILIFDFADYAVQDNFLKRLAFYAEKAGFVGRLAPDREIAGLHGWNAHDYRAETLAAFFDLAAKTNFPLLPEEKELEAILHNSGIIRNSNGNIVPGEGAIISIARESPDYLRYLFIAHEGYHGLFFIDADFREFTRQRWEAFAPVPKAFILSYFGYQAYDTNDNYLVINEFMAHILQQSVSQAAGYFGETLANRIDASSWRRTVLPPKDEATGTWPLLANAFTVEAEAFSRYVNQRWGLAAGRVRKVTISN